MGCGMAGLGVIHFLSVVSLSALIAWLVLSYSKRSAWDGSSGERNGLEVVRDDEFLTSTQPRIPRAMCSQPEWILAALFASLGFGMGGWAVFRNGLHQFALGPLPPGVVTCGNCALGGLFMMLIGAPLAALAFAIVA